MRLLGTLLIGLVLGYAALAALLYAFQSRFIYFPEMGRQDRATPAQLAAAEIHSDIARGFIRAEVVSYDALIARGAMAACRDHAEVRLEGKDYVVQDGDIINFRFAT